MNHIDRMYMQHYAGCEHKTEGGKVITQFIPEEDECSRCGFIVPNRVLTEAEQRVSGLPWNYALKTRPVTVGGDTCQCEARRRDGFCSCGLRAITDPDPKQWKNFAPRNMAVIIDEAKPVHDDVERVFTALFGNWWKTYDRPPEPGRTEVM